MKPYFWIMSRTPMAPFFAAAWPLFAAAWPFLRAEASLLLLDLPAPARSEPLPSSSSPPSGGTLEDEEKLGWAADVLDRFGPPGPDDVLRWRTCGRIFPLIAGKSNDDASCANDTRGAVDIRNPCVRATRIGLYGRAPTWSSESSAEIFGEAK